MSLEVTPCTVLYVIKIENLLRNNTKYKNWTMKKKTISTYIYTITPYISPRPQLKWLAARLAKFPKDIIKSV